jgi:hypothetical protein
MIRFYSRGSPIFPRVKQDLLGFLFGDSMSMDMGVSGFRVNIESGLHTRILSV